MKKKRRGIRADRVYLCTTLFFAVLCLGMFLVMDYQYDELCKVNDDLIETIDTSRENYNNNLEEVKTTYEDKLMKYYEGYITAEHYQYYLEELFEGIPDNSSLMLLAKCVQAEAGDYANHSTSQQMVTRVILNRVSSDKFPNTVEEVIYQRNENGGGIQFSVAYNGALDSVELTPDTLANVYSAILFNEVDVPENVLYFYSENLKEDNWIKSLKKYDTVEGTIFCYDEKEE